MYQKQKTKKHRGKLLKTKIALSALAVWFILLAAGYINLITPELAKANELVKIPISHNNVKKVSVEEQVWNIMDARGLTLQEKIKMATVIQCESAFNQYALNKNSNGSWDTGVAQWNSKAHAEVSRECSFNVECAINKMIDLYRHDKNFHQWNCSK